MCQKCQRTLLEITYIFSVQLQCAAVFSMVHVVVNWLTKKKHTPLLHLLLSNTPF